MNNKQKYIDSVMNNRTKYSQKQKMKRLYEETHSVVPQIYAAFALTLSYKNYNWDSDKIEQLFNETMELWDDCARNGVNMCKWCEEVTGIDVEGVKR